jgi:preprotein translocase subunit YajC
MIVHDLLTRMALFAADAPGQGADGQSPGGGLMQMLLLVGVPILFLWLLLMRPQQKAERARRMAVQALKPNDHVVTAGGIFGVVTNVHREAQIVTIRVDEGNNTKIRVSLGSISRVLSGEPPADPPSK